ncbi:MAG: M20/M25/M40 family metallo-hydrolase [Deltaproteobacteria bacterium]|nr:M20/M25/M40 family metallo-hydrolase [Deltaproteobacteria bacterium]
MGLDLLAAARELIAADSVSARGNLAAVAVLEGVAASLGLEWYRQEATALGAPQANLIVHPRGAPPQDGDTLYGLGVADVKLDALAKLSALAGAPESARGRLAFCGTFVEEVGCLGAKHFLAKRSFTPAFVACGEPSELKIIDAHKGYLVARIEVEGPAQAAPSGRLRLTFHGKAAHSSTPHLGKNAIEAALAFCAAQRLPILAMEGGDLANKVPARCTVEVPDQTGLPEAAGLAGAGVEGLANEEGAPPLDVAVRIARELQRTVAGVQPLSDERFSPATTVSSIGVMRARGGTVELTCDARLLPGHDPWAILDHLDTFAQDLARDEGVRVSITRDRANPAMALPARSRLRDAARDASRALGLDPVPQAKPTNTEGGVFVHAGIEALVFGPGVSTGNAHAANERQSLSQLQEAGRWYAQLIRKLCA